MDIRDAEASELDALAGLWYEGWQDAHAAIVPRRLRELRTLESFRDRLAARLAHIRVSGPVGAPLGFCINEGDELYQLYVAPAARGSGLALALTRDSEARLAAAGVKTAWLACSVGNDRAARFYEKAGWRRVRTEPYLAETSEGAFHLDVWRYEKEVRPA
jgi:ribosomal protein S18 acetylase RimI-like enzyme